MGDYKKSIPFYQFPKTFQDAIRICRALSVDYIWIDSLCNIQDKKEDWEIQGSKMDQVYTNASARQSGSFNTGPGVASGN